MKICVICGFLGSGKTTLLLSLAEHFSKLGLKIAVVENEVGKIGIDNEVIKKNGFAVKSIFSGCICCSLRGDLISTLLLIEREFSPDLVFLEPSGVAGPKQVLSALIGYGGEIDDKFVVNIIDAARFVAIKDFSIPLICDGISVADLILINKVDLVEQKQLKIIYENIAPYTNEKSQCKEVSLYHDPKIIIEDISNLMLANSNSEDNPDITIHETQHKHNAPKPSVVAVRKTINVNDETNLDELISEIKLNLFHVSRSLHSKNAFQGHLKIFLNAGQHGSFIISSTSSDLKPLCKGCFKSKPSKIFFTLNAIVYDISEGDLEDVIENKLVSKI